MSWDEDDFEPPSVLPVVGVSTKTAPPKKFEDEDKPEEKTKESWESEIKTEEASNSAKKKSKDKIKEKEKESKESEGPLDPETEKLRLQQKQEEEKLENAQALFSGLELNKDLVIDLKNPKDEKDFEVLGDLLASKVAIFEKSIHYRNFLKIFIKKASAGLKIEDLKELSTAITVLANEKLQAEKTKKKKKGTSTSKKSINVKDDGDYDNVDDEYADFM